MYKVGMIPYSNMAPFRELGPPINSVFIDAVPSKSIEMLKSGEILAAAAPVGAMPEISDIVEWAGNYGIASKGKVQSVLLFSSIPFNEFNRNSRIKITSQTATSVRLLCLLLGYENGFNEIPSLTTECISRKCSGDEAELLIGDEALMRNFRAQDKKNKEKDESNPGKYHGSKDPHRDKFIYDLSELWWERNSLPFVFARWIVRKDAPLEFKTNLNLWLNQMIVQEDSLILKAAPKEAKKLNIETNKMISYLRGMNRVIDEEAIRGQELFLKNLSKINSQSLLNGKPL
jgi:chorismate dehydratase